MIVALLMVDEHNQEQRRYESIALSGTCITWPYQVLGAVVPGGGMENKWE
jgi:hypothetical protein